ncbi:MAG: DUF2779 domain-containing protein [Parcubacteria group bacterium]
MLTKTNYILWRECPKNAWLKVHKPEIYFANPLSEFEKQIIETGNEVELVARELFPLGTLVESRGEEAVSKTKKLLDQGEATLFQATLEKDGYFAALDVLKKEEGGKFSVYEIKATNSIDKKTHYHDLAFQVNLARLSGLEVESAYLMHLNPEYVRDGELDKTNLFVIEDVTEEIEEMLPVVREEAVLAKSYVESDKEPAGYCACIQKGRSGHCTTFKYSNPDIPEYGVHDLARIGLSKRKLTELVDGHVFRLEDIPEDLDLSDVQQNQLWTYLKDREIISNDDITEELEKLVFPLYFLDYETFPSALPRFDGYSPYQQIPFQYSLHILEGPDAEPVHKDFLYTENTDPSRAFYESLKSHIGNIGSVIVWHKSFECGRNREIAERVPESQEFFKDLDNRVYDLEDIFKKQHYVHKNFKGSSSIKKVLPVLAPELSYKDLEIREGGSAAEAWDRATRGELEGTEKEGLFHNLREYCKLDTYAMYAIWKKLREMVY